MEVIQEFMTVGDYCKVFDFLQLTKEEFLDSYSYINEESYNLSLEVAMQPEYLAQLFRQAENLFQMESDVGLDRDEIDYMQEAGTDYMSSADWKWVIYKFMSNNYDREHFNEFNEICNSMGV